MDFPKDGTADESHQLADGDGFMARPAGLDRDEVRAAVRQELLAMSGSSSAAAESQPAPPSYDASAQLLESDPAADAENGRSHTTPTNKPQPLPLWQRAVLTLLGLCVTLSPLILIITLGETGHDPLRLGMLSMYLVAGLSLGYMTLPVSTPGVASAHGRLSVC